MRLYDQYNMSYQLSNKRKTIRHLDDIAIIQHDALNEGNEQNFYCFLKARVIILFVYDAII